MIPTARGRSVYLGKKPCIGSVVVISIVLAFMGCAAGRASVRTRPELATQLRAIRSVVLLPPDIRVYARTSRYDRSLREDWSIKGTQNVADALAKGLRKRQIEMRAATPEGDLAEAIRGAQARYQAVESGIYSSTSRNIPPDPEGSLDFSIGSTEEICRAYGADAVVLARGVYQKFTGEYKALAATYSLLFSSSHTNPDPDEILGPGSTHFSVLLADKTGAVLWISKQESDWGYDLTDPASVSALTERVLKGFPRVRR
jgi:hypothetical protein